jgi:hypothetical protein
MEEASFRAALSAKVDVSVRLVQVFCENQLDFVLFFSSLLSFDKPAGQSNYSAGCAFKDAFAHALGGAWPCPVKVMNWGYWGNVGIVASADYRARMARAGFGSIEAEEGMAALEVLLAAPQNQLALVKTSGMVASDESGVQESTRRRCRQRLPDCWCIRSGSSGVSRSKGAFTCRRWRNHSARCCGSS